MKPIQYYIYTRTSSPSTFNKTSSTYQVDTCHLFLEKQGLNIPAPLVFKELCPCETPLTERPVFMSLIKLVKSNSDSLIHSCILVANISRIGRNLHTLEAALNFAAEGVFFSPADAPNLFNLPRGSLPSDSLFQQKLALIRAFSDKLVRDKFYFVRLLQLSRDKAVTLQKETGKLPVARQKTILQIHPSAKQVILDNPLLSITQLARLLFDKGVKSRNGLPLDRKCLLQARLYLHDHP